MIDCFFSVTKNKYLNIDGFIYCLYILGMDATEKKIKITEKQGKLWKHLLLYLTR